MGYTPPPPPPDPDSVPVSVQGQIPPKPTDTSYGTIGDDWPWWVYWAITVLILAFVAAVVIFAKGGTAF